jgi:hypothetical protein
VADAEYSDGFRGDGRRRNLVRFSQIGRILVRHGFGFVFDVRRSRGAERGAEEILAPNFGIRPRIGLLHSIALSCKTPAKPASPLKSNTVLRQATCSQWCQSGVRLLILQRVAN